MSRNDVQTRSPRLSLPLWHERYAARAAADDARPRWRARGWDAVDVVFVTGDAYVDHPSFAMAILRPRAGGGRASASRS